MEELANEVKINEVDYNRNGLSQEVEEPTLIITVKGKGIKGGGKTPDKVWMHPYLAVDNGFIKDMAEAKAYFRKEYDKKYTKSLPFNK